MSTDPPPDTPTASHVPPAGGPTLSSPLLPTSSSPRLTTTDHAGHNLSPDILTSSHSSSTTAALASTIPPTSPSSPSTIVAPLTSSAASSPTTSSRQTSSQFHDSGPSPDHTPSPVSSSSPATSQLPSPQPDHRHPRRAPAPSPLSQTALRSPLNRGPASPTNTTGSTTPTASRRTSGSYFSRSVLPSPLQSDTQQPRSPREELDALLATENTTYSPRGLPPSPLAAVEEERRTAVAAAPSPAAAAIIATAAPRPRSVAKAASFSQLRLGGRPSLHTTSPPSSPSPSPSMLVMPPSKSLISDTRPVVPRTASIDSAVSSISSSASQSYRTNQPNQRKASTDSMTSPPDMATLIAAAGSPEAAMLAMWKDKQNASMHNAQLWRLVEKQRAMIIGLNKDLERSLKDKERYRKRMKEQMAQNASGVPVKKADSLTRGTSQSPAPSADPAVRSRSALDSVSDVSSVPLSGLGLRSNSLVDPTNSTVSRDLPPVEPSDSVSVQASTAESTSNDQSPELVQPRQRKISSESTPKVEIDTSVVKAADAKQPTLGPDGLPVSPTAMPQPLSFSKKVAAQPEQLMVAPTVSITAATPNMADNEFPSPTAKSPSTRKAPPTPLNLASDKLQWKPTFNIEEAPDTADVEPEAESESVAKEDSGDDSLFRRGRKKTREEDDSRREAILTMEAESRSKSAKKSKPASSADPHIKSPGHLAAKSTRNVKSLSPPGGGATASPRMSPAGATASLNAILSPANSDFSQSNKSTRRSVLMSPPLASPGLPVSPRPGDRPLGSPNPRVQQVKQLASPPTSPAANSHTLSPRAPKQAIPMPPQTPLSFASPHLARAEQYEQARRQDQPAAVAKEPAKDNTLSPPKDSLDAEDTHVKEALSLDHVYKGFMTDKYPNLLLPPCALPLIDVKVFSSRLRPSRHSFLAGRPNEEDPVYLLGIYSRENNKQLWQVEKTIVHLPQLDQQLRSLSSFNGSMPERGLFTGHAPAKIDARRHALNQYFAAVLQTAFDEKAALVVCDFFSSDVIGAVADDGKDSPKNVAAACGPKTKPKKEGYLTKRGKNFGGWKSRFFVLHGPDFRYFESQGGSHLGTIRLHNAQIGKQSGGQPGQGGSHGGDDAENQYRHAFLILEPKRKDSTSHVRHVLCAESDEERDSWVETLLQYVGAEEDSKETDAKANTSSRTVLSKAAEAQRNKGNLSPGLGDPNTLHGLSYEKTVQAEAPIHGKKSNTPVSPTQASLPLRSEPAHPAISGPTNGSVIRDTEMWGNKATPAAHSSNSLQTPTTATRDKKRSFFGLSKRSGSDSHPAPVSVPQTPMFNPPPPAQRPTFAVSLSESVEIATAAGGNQFLPAVVFRCIEYMHHMKAINEEGIFRLSGSNVVIRQLRERFNTEGDVKLIDGEYYDVHAVASLLKLYLRELPNTILTRGLHLSFLNVLDLDDRERKVQAFNVLVNKLPRINYELIFALSSYLIEIVNNSQINKMTIRNVGIVFAPTLNIPAPLISFFLTDFPTIFGEPLDDSYCGVDIPDTTDEEAINAAYKNAQASNRLSFFQPAVQTPLQTPRTTAPRPASTFLTLGQGTHASATNGSPGPFTRERRTTESPASRERRAAESPAQRERRGTNSPARSDHSGGSRTAPSQPTQPIPSGLGGPVQPSYDAPAGLTSKQHQQIQQQQQYGQPPPPQSAGYDSQSVTHQHQMLMQQAMQQQMMQQQGGNSSDGQGGFAAINGAMYPSTSPASDAPVQDRKSMMRAKRESNMLFMNAPPVIPGGGRGRR